MSGITVQGVGRVRRAPDRATVSLVAEARAASAGEAHRAAGGRMVRVIAALRGSGIAEADIATRSVDLQATYEYSDSGQRLTGYAARQAIDVTVVDLDRLPAVIDGAVEAGADQIAGISLSLADPSAAMDEARREAFADARARAETLAAVAGLTLGRPTDVTEARGRGGPPVPVARFEAMTASETPIAPGTTEVEVEVEVVFAIAG